MPNKWNRLKTHVAENKRDLALIALGGVAGLTGCMVGLKLTPAIKIRVTPEQLKMMLANPNLVLVAKTFPGPTIIGIPPK